MNRFVRKGETEMFDARQNNLQDVTKFVPMRILLRGAAKAFRGGVPASTFKQVLDVESESPSNHSLTK